MKLFRGHLFLWFTVLIQALLVGVTFSPLLRQPNSYLFQISGDGAKNYFTYLAYLHQPFNQGLLKFEQFNYPFGEYLFYTDNTPVFALAVKLFSYYIYDVTAHSLLIFHLFLMSGILISSILVYLILKRLIQRTWLIVFFSIVLPWIHPQIFRLEIGHYNLSFAFVLLFTLLFLLRSYQKFYTGKNIVPELFWFIPVVITCSFLHLYYLPVVLVFVGFFCGAWLIQVYRQRANYHLLLGWSATLMLVPAGVVYCLIRLADGYYNLREPGAGGYDANSTKLFLKALFTPYFITELSSKFRAENLIPYEFGIESNAYLGSFAISVGAVMLSYWLKSYRLNFFSTETLAKQEDDTSLKIFFMLFAFAAFSCLFISPGDKFHFAEKDVGINNYLNLFRYLKQLSPNVTHFRQLGRFGWIFFWFFNFWIIYQYEHLLFKHRRQRLIQIVAYAFLGLAALDMLYIQLYYRKNLYPFTLQAADVKAHSFGNVAWQPTHFQAILPIPYYYIGCENEDYFFTLDNGFFLKTVQLSLHTHLPLMASNMSRSATSHAQAFYETITTGKVTPELATRLKQKPILVAIDTSFYNGKPNVYTKITQEKARAVFNAGRSFVQKHHLLPVGHYQNLQLYSWKMK